MNLQERAAHQKKLIEDLDSFKRLLDQLKESPTIKIEVGSTKNHRSRTIAWPRKLIEQIKVGLPFHIERMKEAAEAEIERLEKETI